ncbi:MAG: glycosyltransferase family 2 protein, partial [Anaerolineales bacterium]
QVYNRYKREAIALKRIWPSERFSLAELIKLYLSNVANDARQAGRQGVLVRELTGILRFRWMQFWGTYRGFGHRGPLSSELKRALYYPPRRQPDRSVRSREVTPLEYGRAQGDPPES